MSGGFHRFRDEASCQRIHQNGRVTLLPAQCSGLSHWPVAGPMAASFYPARVAPYQFRRGGKADSPILLPLAVLGADLPAMTLLCRRICPTAPVLVPDIDRLAERGPAAATVSRAAADRVADVVTAAVYTHGLSLVPIIVLGHGEGADMAAQLLLTHAPLLSACILLRPTARIGAVTPGTLDGIHVLLARAGSEEVIGTVGWQIHGRLIQAGAVVICERVAAHRKPGIREAVIGRVFVSTLFGT